MFSMTFWNVKGLNTFNKQKEVNVLVNQHKPCICILVETQVKAKNKEKIMGEFNGWTLVNNYEHHGKGKIWFIYRSYLIIFSAIHISAQMIMGRVEIKANKKSFLCSAIYASNNQEERKDLWQILEQTSQSLNLPWVVTRD